jgi:hypothetical protein
MRMPVQTLHDVSTAGICPLIYTFHYTWVPLGVKSLASQLCQMFDGVLCCGADIPFVFSRMCFFIHILNEACILLVKSP